MKMFLRCYIIYYKYNILYYIILYYMYYMDG